MSICFPSAADVVKQSVFPGKLSGMQWQNHRNIRSIHTINEEKDER
jgi:hypothetical protein